MSENKPPILHILVVGFHHKLGCQVEFSYPPLIAGTSGKNECPSGWKYLPTLSLPDGSHNFLEDTVFFNLPSLTDPTESVYGVSCYRQIPVEKLKIRTADVTRSTVQKAVCILSRLPIYGYIEVKLSLIANAFFEQGDFSGVDILVKAYQQLNACLLDDESRRSLRHFYVGLSLREIILRWRHKTLILFKLFLLQRRVVFFSSPVSGMCAIILGIASLIPRLLEKGFQEVACVRTSRPMSPMPDYTAAINQSCSNTPKREVNASVSFTKLITGPQESLLIGDHENVIIDATNRTGNKSSCSDDSDGLAISSSSPARESPDDSISSNLGEIIRDDTNGIEFFVKKTERNNSLTRESSIDTLASNLFALSSINPDEYRAPITIFASGNLCLPYLSLPYMDLLSDPSVHSYIIGTSNVLFQQKRNLADIQIDVENCSMETTDQELRRQLVLSTEDLRFVDYMLRHVQSPKEDAEGSEHWIRDQFQGYMLSLLRTAVVPDSTQKDYDHFNSYYMNAFKKTQCFQEWYDVRPDQKFFESLPSGHPFAGTLSMADMKLKLAQTMHGTEGGRKINQAVSTTSRAVGGAISQAKGAFSNWWSSITTTPPTSIATNNVENDLQQIDTIQQEKTYNDEKYDNTNDDDSVVIESNKNDEAFTKNDMHDTSLVITSPESVSGCEKLIDSAEELIEDEIEIATTALNHPPPVSNVTVPEVAEATASPALTEKNNLENIVKLAPQNGIVEIGKEAELLNSSANILRGSNNFFGKGDSISSEKTDGKVFIV